MIETGLVYLYTATPARQFVGCGAAVEGGYIATCRHVWRDAMRAVERHQPNGPPGIRVEYPHAREAGVTITCMARLVDACAASGNDAEPDLVLIVAERTPSGIMPLHLAAHDRFQTGPGYAIAGIIGLHENRPKEIRQSELHGVIAESLDPEGRRQFTGDNPTGYWSAPGSSGSPVFREGGQQLAGILSLSEVGEEPGKAPRHEAYIVPATTIRRYVGALVASPMAEQEGIKPADLHPILAAIGAADVPVAEIPERLRQFVEAARARGAEPVAPSNDGADIDAVIGAARDKLGALDVAGARDVLQAKIAEEEAARRARLLPLLKERAAVERVAFDHAAAMATLGEITRLEPDDVWAWIDLGEEWLTTGSLDNAASSFRWAQAAAERNGDPRERAVSRFWIGSILEVQGNLAGALTEFREYRAIMETLAARNAGNTTWQRDLSVSHNKLGDVQVAQGDLAGALAAYRTGLAIRETLAARDAGNTVWQRDLSVSHQKLGDVQVAQGDLAGALAAYRTGLAIRETLAARDAGNTAWQRDLSISHQRLGDVQVAQGDLAGALAAYRTDLAIMETLAARDAGNTAWQRDLSVSHNKLGDVQEAQGDLAGALAAYRTGLAIMETLAARDAGNTAWQRDLSVSHNKLGDVQVAQGDLAGALAAYRTGLAIRETLAARDAGNTAWQRDLSVSHERLGDVQVAQGDLAGALAAYRTGLAIMETLAARDAGNTVWQRDLSVSHEKLGDVQVAQGDLAGALAAYRTGLAIRETLAARDAGNTAWQRDLPISLGRIAGVLVKQLELAEARPLAERALMLVRSAMVRFPDDPRIARDLPYYEGLLRRAGG